MTGNTYRPIAGNIERAGHELAVERDLALGRSRRRQDQSPRPLVDCNEAVEPEQFGQGSAVVAVHARADVELGRSERREIVDLERLASGSGIALQRDAESAGAAIDLEFRVRARGRTRIDRQRGAQCDRGQPSGRAAQLVGGGRSELLQERQHAVERTRVEVERQRAARRLRSGIDPPFDRERRAAEIGDGELLDLEPVRTDLQAHVDLLGIDAGDGRARDLERQRAFARPVECGVAEHGLGESVDAVEIDFGRGERSVEPRRPVSLRPGIGQTSRHRHAVELELEPIDRDGIVAERDVAAQPQRAGDRGLGIGAFAQPADERARIARFDPGRSRELHARRRRARRRAETSAQTQLRRPRRAQLQLLDVQTVGVGLQVGADALRALRRRA